MNYKNYKNELKKRAPPLGEQIAGIVQFASQAWSSSKRTWKKIYQFLCPYFNHSSYTLHKLTKITDANWYEYQQVLITHFFFSALWWTRIAAPKAPRPICSMISYWSIRDSIAITDQTPPIQCFLKSNLNENKTIIFPGVTKAQSTKPKCFSIWIEWSLSALWFIYK